MSRACSTCIWFQSLDADTGLCRVEPPTTGPSVSHWALVQPADWCSKWTDTDPAPPPLMPAVSGVAPTQPSIAVTAEVMLGLGLVTGFSITPVRTGRIAAIMSGTVTSSTANAQINITGRQATGTAPANGDAVTGTLWGTTQHYVIKTSADVHGFTVIGGSASLPLNVATWFDLSIASPAGGTTTIDDVQSLLFEL
jgi:hypothetical protein